MELFPGSNPGPTPVSGGAYYGHVQAMNGSPLTLVSPLWAALLKNKAKAQTRGIGDTFGTGVAVGGAAILTVVALCGVSGFFAGRAMTPSGRDKTKWGLGGAAAALLGGPLGLGIQGLYATSKGK